MTPVDVIADISALVASSKPHLGRTRLVAVDGPGGAGKTTLALRIAEACSAQIVHTDDFPSWDNQLGWWPRLESQVLQPLSRNRTGRYQRYDWDHRRYADWHEVFPGGVVILEGVSSGRAAVRERLSVLVWVEAPGAVRLARGLRRDGPDALPLWQRWIADEDQHFAADRTREYADLVVSHDSTGS